MGDVDKWISTKTSDYNTALKKAKEITESCFKGQQLLRTESLECERKKKIADAVIGVLTDSGKDGLRVDEAFNRWVELTPSYSDIGDRTKSFYGGVFGKFVQWNTERKSEYLEQIDQGTALMYSKHLWDSGISAKTYNDHLKILSRIFSTLDAASPMPYRNPFNNRTIHRKKKSEMESIGHQPLEPEMLNAVIAEAARDSLDYRDLIIIGSQTAMIR